MADDYTASTSTTGIVAIGNSTTGSIETNGDTDWFAVTLATGRRYQFDLQGLSTGNGTLDDPYLALRDNAGNVITTNDDAVGRDSRITYTVGAAGTYYLSASSAHGGGAVGTGTYRLAATLLPTTPIDDFAANTSTTGSVPVDGTTYGNIEVDGDVDWFAVTLTAGNTYRFDMQTTSAGGSSNWLDDPFLSLHDGAGNLITYNDDAVGRESRITYTATTGGTYYLAASSAHGGGTVGTGQYRVAVTNLADDYAANTSTTGVLPNNGSVGGIIEVDGDTDWFAASLVAGHEYRFELLRSTGVALRDPFLTLRDGSGNEITSDDDGAGNRDSLIDYVPSTTGTYYLEARSASAGGTFGSGSYLLTQDDRGVYDDFPANTSTTGSVAVGSSVDGKIERYGDNDWLRVTLVAGQTYQFDLHSLTLSDPFLVLLDGSGGVIASDDDSGPGRDSQISYTATSSGTFFLSAADTSSHATGNYRLFATNVLDDYGASTSTTGSVVVGGSTTGSIGNDGDTDWFAVTLVAGHSYRFDLQGQATGNGTLDDPLLTLRDSSGTVITSNDDAVGRDSRIIYAATSGGTYYLSAASAHGGGTVGTGTYRLAATDVTDDYAASPLTSGTVPMNGSATGTIESDGDRDWLAVSVTAGHSYRFDLQGLPTGNGTLDDPYLSVRDAAGNIYAYNDDGYGRDSRINWVAPTTGTFYLEASSAHGGGSIGTGTYRVAATDNTPADDYSANAATTGSVVVGSYATGNIQDPGDSDWFAVSLISGHTYDFNLLGSADGFGTLGSPLLSLLDSSGTLVQASGSNPGSVTWTATSSGTFYLAATSNGTGATGTGTYRLTAADEAAADDFAGNTTTSGHISIGSGSSRGTIEAGGDTDWFAVNLVSGHDYSFQLSTPDMGPSLANPLLELRDGSGNLLLTGTGSGYSAITCTATATGTYYLVARSSSGAATGPYFVSATDRAADDYLATTNTTGTFSSPQSGAFNGAGGNIQTSDDHDWFKTTLVKGATYQFDLSSTTTSMVLGLRDSTGALLTTAAVGADSRLTWTATSSGTYILDAAANGGDTGSYSLWATKLDDFGSSIWSAGSMNVYDNVSGNIETNGDSDWVAITLTAGHDYQFQLRGAPFGMGTLDDPFLTLRNASGAVLSSNDDSGTRDSVINWTAPVTATYYLAASSAHGNGTIGTGSYVLYAADKADDYLANTSTTGVMPMGGSVSGNLEVDGDSDWFSVSVTAGHTYYFVDQHVTMDDPFLALLDSSGHTIATDDDSYGHRDSQIIWTAPSTGTVYLAASSAHGGGTFGHGTYTLSATDHTDDYPADSSTTGVVAIGGSATGRIDGPGDVDWFAVTLAAGHTYQLDLKGSESGNGTLADPFLRLRDSLGNSIAYSDDANVWPALHDSRINVTPTSSGTFFLCASAAGPNTPSGTYTLFVTQTA